MTVLVVGLAVAVALLGVLVMGLLRSNAEVLRALHRLGVDLDPNAPVDSAGSEVRVPLGPTARPASTARPTPGRPDATDVVDLTGVTPLGDAISLAVKDVTHDTLVAFLTSGCTTCRRFWDVFRDSVPDVPGGARLVIATRGPAAESPGLLAGMSGVTPVVMSDQAWDHYDIPYAPYFVYISGPAGKVMGEGVAAGWEEVKALVSNAVADGTTRPRSLKNRSRADQARDDEVDRQLRASGIHPGDPRLHPSSISAGDSPS